MKPNLHLGRFLVGNYYFLERISPLMENLLSTSTKELQCPSDVDMELAQIN